MDHVAFSTLDSESLVGFYLLGGPPLKLVSDHPNPLAFTDAVIHFEIKLQSPSPKCLCP